jgi:hypothetical protein
LFSFYYILDDKIRRNSEGGITEEAYQATNFPLIYKKNEENALSGAGKSFTHRPQDRVGAIIALFLKLNFLSSLQSFCSQ